MSRFKFRSWDGKEMHSPIALDDEGRGVRGGYQWWSVDNTLLHAPVMQSTGLTDKNGKEIFEGDIVQTGKDVLYEDQGEYIVEHRVGYTGFYLIYPSHSERWLCLLDKDEIDALDLRVIGNIHENPELLDNP